MKNYDEYTLEKKFNSDDYKLILEKSTFSAYRDIQHKVLKEYGSQLYFVATFNSAIVSLYPVISQIIYNSNYNIQLSNYQIVLLTIFAIAEILHVNNDEIKNMKKKIDDEGLLHLVEKIKITLLSIKRLVKIISKTIGKTISFFVDMLSYVSILVPINDALVEILQHDGGLNVESLPQKILGLGIGLGLLTTKNIIMKILNKMGFNKTINIEEKIDKSIKDEMKKNIYHSMRTKEKIPIKKIPIKKKEKIKVFEQFDDPFGEENYNKRDLIKELQMCRRYVLDMWVRDISPISDSSFSFSDAKRNSSFVIQISDNKIILRKSHPYSDEIIELNEPTTENILSGVNKLKNLKMFEQIDDPFGEEDYNTHHNLFEELKKYRRLVLDMWFGNVTQITGNFFTFLDTKRDLKLIIQILGNKIILRKDAGYTVLGDPTEENIISGIKKLMGLNEQFEDDPFGEEKDYKTDHMVLIQNDRGYYIAEAINGFYVYYFYKADIIGDVRTWHRITDISKMNDDDIINIYDKYNQFKYKRKISETYDDMDLYWSLVKWKHLPQEIKEQLNK